MTESIQIAEERIISNRISFGYVVKVGEMFICAYKSHRPANYHKVYVLKKNHVRMARVFDDRAEAQEVANQFNGAVLHIKRQEIFSTTDIDKWGV